MKVSKLEIASDFILFLFEVPVAFFSRWENAIRLPRFPSSESATRHLQLTLDTIGLSFDAKAIIHDQYSTNRVELDILSIGV